MIYDIWERMPYCPAISVTFPDFTMASERYIYGLEVSKIVNIIVVILMICVPYGSIEAYQYETASPL